MKKICSFLRDPLYDGKLKLTPSLLTLLASIFVNAYFLRTSFEALVSWFIKISKGALTAETQEAITVVVSQSNSGFAMKIAFGLLMTTFAMTFLLTAAYFAEEKQNRNVGNVFKRACSTMLVPMLFMLVSALTMNLSIIAGIVFAIFAVVDCSAVIVKSSQKVKLNSYTIIAIETAFFLITVVLCTRNHFVTMFG